MGVDTDIWGELDGAAESNLGTSGLYRFLKYKRELFESGIDWSEASQILTGYIWEESESHDDFD